MYLHLLYHWRKYYYKRMSDTRWSIIKPRKEVMHCKDENNFHVYAEDTCQKVRGDRADGQFLEKRRSPDSQDRQV